MTRTCKRREFLKQAASAGIGFGVLGGLDFRFAKGANERIQIAVVGVNSRGHALAEAFAHLEDAHVAYVCDVDIRATSRTVQAVAALQDRRPVGLEDFRQALEDPSLDAVVIATPDHWHAPASILALDAGKHVYVEKPCSHNPAEGEMLVAAARRSKKICQMGNQRRSWSKIKEAVGRLKEGAIGPVHYVRYRDKVVHYNWHWFWHWATGEAGNNGVHSLDLARWGVGADYPTRVTSAGGRYYAEDDWQPPDTQMNSFEFPNRVLVTWEGMSCNAVGAEGEGFGVLFQGKRGSLRLLPGNGYVLYDDQGKEMRAETEAGDSPEASVVGPGLGYDLVHARNFLESIRGRQAPASEIEEGHKSTMLIHLGNIAQRTGRPLTCDPKTGRIQDDQEAMRYWKREYEPGWEPKGE